ncbi:DUF2520 domain-containing protein, partial [Streptomyces anthocyanicus]
APDGSTGPDGPTDAARGPATDGPAKDGPHRRKRTPDADADAGSEGAPAPEGSPDPDGPDGPTGPERPAGPTGPTGTDDGGAR